MAKKQFYSVRWEIEVNATSPRQAAKEALKIQRDAKSMAIVFEVTSEDGEHLYHVDLLERK